jgi:putative transposase
MINCMSYKRHRYPPEIIARAVWLYFRFPLSLRLGEEILLERGIVVSYETIRRWGKKFGPDYACRFRRKPPRPDDIWHLDEVVIISAGMKHWLWRAVDQDGYVLDEIVQTRRSTKAAKRLLARLLRKQGVELKCMITDQLGSHGAAKKEVLPRVEHRSHKGLNKRAENSHTLFENENGSSSISDRREPCSASSRSSPPSAISSVEQRAKLPMPGARTASRTDHPGCATIPLLSGSRWSAMHGDNRGDQAMRPSGW